ncbi:hypothetical protein Sbs19_32890 [Sphingobium sp. BS19]|nr:hypothetical protein Sbs19_32890 [Sphingobium sp. BS19]
MPGSALEVGGGMFRPDATFFLHAPFKPLGLLRLKAELAAIRIEFDKLGNKQIAPQWIFTRFAQL